MSKTASHPLTVTYQATDSLIPDPRNARIHTPAQIAQIVASIRAFGFTNPILADPEGRLVAGHGRLLAAKEAELGEVPVIVLAGLSEPQKRALRLADNRIALNAGWDMAVLELELAELSLPEIDIDIGLTGFSSGEIGTLLKGGGKPKEKAAPPRTRPGDIWRLDEHRIGCGDPKDSCLREAIAGEAGARTDEAVLDIFLGLDASLIADDRLGGIDRDPKRVDAAVARWERLTGRTAQRVPGDTGLAA